MSTSAPNAKAATTNAAADTSQLDPLSAPAAGAGVGVATNAAATASPAPAADPFAAVVQRWTHAVYDGAAQQLVAPVCALITSYAHAPCSLFVRAELVPAMDALELALREVQIANEPARPPRAPFSTRYEWSGPMVLSPQYGVAHRTNESGGPHTLTPETWLKSWTQSAEPWPRQYLSGNETVAAAQGQRISRAFDVVTALLRALVTAPHMVLGACGHDYNGFGAVDLYVQPAEAADVISANGDGDPTDAFAGSLGLFGAPRWAPKGSIAPGAEFVGMSYITVTLRIPPQNDDVKAAARADPPGVRIILGISDNHEVTFRI